MKSLSATSSFVTRLASVGSLKRAKIVRNYYNYDEFLTGKDTVTLPHIKEMRWAASTTMNMKKFYQNNIQSRKQSADSESVKDLLAIAIAIAECTASDPRRRARLNHPQKCLWTLEPS